MSAYSVGLHPVKEDVANERRNNIGLYFVIFVISGISGISGIHIHNALITVNSPVEASK